MKPLFEKEEEGGRGRRLVPGFALSWGLGGGSYFMHGHSEEIAMIILVVCAVLSL